MGVTGSLGAVGFIIQLLLTPGRAPWTPILYLYHPITAHGEGAPSGVQVSRALSSGSPNTGLDIMHPAFPQGAPIQNACLLMALEVSGACLC